MTDHEQSSIAFGRAFGHAFAIDDDDIVAIATQIERRRDADDARTDDDDRRVIACTRSGDRHPFDTRRNSAVAFSSSAPSVATTAI